MVDPELFELQREFLDEAKDKVAEMEAMLETGRDREKLDRLAYLAHQLKGSGGSYGFQRISTDAAELEKAIESAVGSNGSARVEEDSIQKYVVNLRGEIERAASTLQ